MKCFVTGGTGVVGRHFLRRLLSDGWSVTLLTRDPGKVRLPEGSKVDFFRGDLDSPETATALDAHRESYDTIFHLAASLDYFGSRETLFATNAGGTGRMARFARQTSARRFIHASSIEAAGSFALPEVPAETSRLGPPISAYGESKLAAEQPALALTHDGIPACSLRIGNVYGPGSFNFVVEFAHALLSRSRLHEWRAAFDDRYISPVHNADVTDGLIAAALGRQTGVFNLVGPAATVGEIFEITADITGTPPRRPVLSWFDRRWIAQHVSRARVGMVPFDSVAYHMAPAAARPHRAFSMEASSRALGWRPAWTLRNGIRDTLLWARTAGHVHFE